MKDHALGQTASKLCLNLKPCEHDCEFNQCKYPFGMGAENHTQPVVKYEWEVVPLSVLPSKGKS